MATPGASAPVAPELPPLAGAARPRSLAMKRIAAALRLLIDVATRPTGPLAKIDRVAISQGRFVIEDELNHETKLYGSVKSTEGQQPCVPHNMTTPCSGVPGGVIDAPPLLKDQRRDNIVVAKN